MVPFAPIDLSKAKRKRNPLPTPTSVRATPSPTSLRVSLPGPNFNPYPTPKSNHLCCGSYYLGTATSVRTPQARDDEVVRTGQISSFRVARVCVYARFDRMVMVYLVLQIF